MSARAPVAKSNNRLIAKPVHTEELLEGEPTTCDIFTSEGHLLVAKGTMLTSEIKLKIAKRRGFQMVPATESQQPRAKRGEDDAEIARRVLDSLDRSTGHGRSEIRQRVRRCMRAKLEVRPLAVGQGEVVQVWTRNLSEQGIGFIARAEIKTDRVIVKLASISVTAEILRRRPIDEGFWEYGARFLDRLTRGH